MQTDITRKKKISCKTVQREVYSSETAPTASNATTTSVEIPCNDAVRTCFHFLKILQILDKSQQSWQSDFAIEKFIFCYQILP